MTGIVLNCLNGTVAALCNRNIRPRVPNLICQQLGFMPSNNTIYKGYICCIVINLPNSLICKIKYVKHSKKTITKSDF